MKKLPRNIRTWLGELNRFTQFGLIVVIVGAVIDLIYHGVLETILPLPVAQADIVQYAGHGITFIGMLIMLLGVAAEGWKRTRGDSSHSTQRTRSISATVSIRRR